MQVDVIRQLGCWTDEEGGGESFQETLQRSCNGWGMWTTTHIRGLRGGGYQKMKIAQTMSHTSSFFVVGLCFD